MAKRSRPTIKSPPVTGRVSKEDARRAVREVMAAEQTLTVQFHGRLLALVKELAQWQELTPVDAVGKALSDAHFLEDRKQHGETLLLETPEHVRYKVRL